MRHLPALTALALALAVAPVPVFAAPGAAHAPAAKRCFKRVHGKRVRAKCKGKRRAPVLSPTAPAAPAPPPLDPALKQQAIGALTGQMLRHFSMSADGGGFQGDEILHICGDGRYKYLAQFSGAADGILGPIVDQAGSWQVTGAEAGANGTTNAGLLLLPGDATSPHFVVVSLAPTIDGYAPYIAGARWYLGPSTLCG